MQSLMLAVLVVFVVGCDSLASEAPTEEPPRQAELTMFTHCGFYEIEHEGVVWTPASIQRGASPEGTGFNTTEGVATVVGDKLTFRADTGLEIIFVPAPAELPPIPGCD